MTQWTDKQLKVINTRDRNILVSAAAGSGKTAVLVERIVKLITDKNNPVDIDQLLVVTFTRAAALEMKERVRDALEAMSDQYPEDVNIARQLAFIHNANISTIDSFCGRVVKENFDKIDLDPNFRIADETEIEMLKSDIIDEMLEEYYQEGKEEFIHLATQYSGGKLSDNLFELIDQLYHYASGHHEPELWVKNCAKNYYAADIEEFSKSSWLCDMLFSIKKKIRGWISSLELAYEISESEGGPKYGESLRVIIDGLTLALSKKSFDDIRHAIYDIEPVRLSGVRGCDEEKKKQVSDIKNSVTKQINQLKSGIINQSLMEVYNDMQKSRMSVDMIIKLTLDFMSRFAKAKAEKGIMDFCDQEHYALKILNEQDGKGNLIPTDTARQIASGFKEIMIDEYQDSNFVQEAILTSISNGHGKNNMFMVGDVKQSIYRFRQANPKLFLGKYDCYTEDLTEDNCKIILDKNFRSRREVIDSVNYIFGYIMNKEVGGIDYRNGNELTLGATYEEPGNHQDNSTEFVMIEGKGKDTEAEYVAQKIKEITNPVTGMKITGKDGKLRTVEYRDIVILMRSLKSNTEIYLKHLSNNGIPAFAKTQNGYYKAMEVRTILDMLSVIDNPLQDIPLVAVMSSPMFQFLDNELACIKAHNMCSYFYQSVKRYSENGKNEQLRNKSAKFIQYINKYREMVPYTSVYELINHILEDTGYGYYILAAPNGNKRYLNIEALKEKAVAYDAISYKGLFNFVRYIEKIQYLSRDDGEASEVSENDNIVQIMSIHKSKGLQFPVVFLCNTNGKGKADTDHIVADDKGNIGVDFIDESLKVKDATIIKKAIRMSNKEEEAAETLRILYVALTRAKEKLFITGLTKDVERDARQFANYRYDTNTHMSYNDIVDGKSLMEWMGKTIGKNKAFDSIVEAGSPGSRMKNPMYCADAHFKVKKVYEEDIVFNELAQDITDQLSKETIEMMCSYQMEETDITKKLKHMFAFEYPHKADIQLYSKASVTEIKKKSMEYNEELDGKLLYDVSGNAYNPEDNKFLLKEQLPEILPQFMKHKEQLNESLSGAKRGTAYHRVFELLDMDKPEYNQKTVKEMLQSFTRKGLLEQEEADSIHVEDIIKFTQTSLFSRMKEAYNRGELFREQKFLMGVPANKINAESCSKDTIVIQGIIDACFIENGKYVIVDYKTDNIRNLRELADKYKIQLQSYANAINQIVGDEKNNMVSDMIIYSVSLGDTITI